MGWRITTDNQCSGCSTGRLSLMKAFIHGFSALNLALLSTRCWLCPVLVSITPTLKAYVVGISQALVVGSWTERFWPPCMRSRQ